MPPEPSSAPSFRKLRMFGVAAAIAGTSRGASRAQTGYIFHYAFVMLIGVVVFISAYLVWAHRGG